MKEVERGKEDGRYRRGRRRGGKSDVEEASFLFFFVFFFLFLFSFSFLLVFSGFSLFFCRFFRLGLMEGLLGGRLPSRTRALDLDDVFGHVDELVDETLAVHFGQNTALIVISVTRFNKMVKLVKASVLF